MLGKAGDAHNFTRVDRWTEAMQHGRQPSAKRKNRFALQRIAKLDALLSFTKSTNARSGAGK
ncbi:hypothetical protein GCM10010981_05230 [Dyella nitratireducens]|uniref:Transposase n=1 Tax=Dyella nitratireducens TaxID=1849580 RepID=A0ABQ1FLK7_9GAMM|nr:hypothetical protein GCM10010981_05230 [Dyella nitratireducens]GLQ44415.1 hypothetical protein GCM10007902_42650 [Dyella nitratireducens]